MEQQALIAMSGGVDSAVAAYLTQQEGFSCVGATMHLHGEFTGAEDARQVAQKLGISQSYISRLEKRIISRLKKEILRLS